MGSINRIFYFERYGCLPGPKLLGPSLRPLSRALFSGENPDFWVFWGSDPPKSKISQKNVRASKEDKKLRRLTQKSLYLGFSSESYGMCPNLVFGPPIPIRTLNGI